MTPPRASGSRSTPPELRKAGERLSDLGWIVSRWIEERWGGASINLGKSVDSGCVAWRGAALLAACLNDRAVLAALLLPQFLSFKIGLRSWMARAVFLRLFEASFHLLPFWPPLLRGWLAPSPIFQPHLTVHPPRRVRVKKNGRDGGVCISERWDGIVWAVWSGGSPGGSLECGPLGCRPFTRRRLPSQVCKGGVLVCVCLCARCGDASIESEL